MTIKSNCIEGTVYFVLLGLLLSMVAAEAADAFYFSGYTYDETNVTLSNTNVTIEEEKMKNYLLNSFYFL